MGVAHHPGNLLMALLGKTGAPRASGYVARTRSKIGEIVEVETRPDSEPERRTVGSLFKVGDGIYHCSVEKPIHQEWLNEFVETVSDRK